MNYPRLMQIENEIKELLAHRLNFEHNFIHVEAYYGMDKSVMCRIELYKGNMEISSRLGKYEAHLQKGFYFEAERALKQQLSHSQPIKETREMALS